VACVGCICGGVAGFSLVAWFAACVFALVTVTSVHFTSFGVCQDGHVHMMSCGDAVPSKAWSKAHHAVTVKGIVWGAEVLWEALQQLPCCCLCSTDRDGA
jgi:hypothetical protein